MSDRPDGSLERTGFAALWAFLLAPIIAQGLWRPLVHLCGPSGDAAVVTGAALAITFALVLVQWLHRGRTPLPSLAVGGLLAIGAAVGWSLGWSGLLTLLAVTAAIAFLLQWPLARLPPALDGLASRHRILTAIYLAAALLAVVSTARLSIFMGDATRVDRQVVPGEKFLETHSCLSAYVRASTLSRQGVDNLYAERWWLGSHGFPPRPPGVEDPFHPFVLDYYAYPPPFLLVMIPLTPFEGNFAAQRALWFGLNGLLLAFGLWIVARWLDGPGAHRIVLLAPIFFGTLPVLGTLQVGNFQIAVVAISVLAMVAFDRDRPALGGALLAFAILSKISPGVLGIVLLAQRRFRAVAWTAGFGVLLLALSVLTAGVEPTRSFLTYTLGRIASGAAFAFMDDSLFSVLTNTSPFGLPFKLQLLGLDAGDPWVTGRLIGRGYGVGLAIVAFVFAATGRSGDRRTQALTWMSLLVLAALQSAFAPLYAIIGLLWAMTLLAVEVRRFRGGIALVALWIVLTVLPPIPSVWFRAVESLVQSIIAVGVPVWLVVRGARGSAHVAERSSIGAPASRSAGSTPPRDGVTVSVQPSRRDA